MWNLIIEDETFHMLGLWFWLRILDRKRKSIPRICVYSCQNEWLPLPGVMVSNVVALLEGLYHTGHSALVSVVKGLDIQ